VYLSARFHRPIVTKHSFHLFICIYNFLPSCEIDIDECESSPCANNGECIDEINGYQCNCTNGFINSHCLKSINETCFGTKSPCQNQGICLLKSSSLYVAKPEAECQCSNGYKGRLCEIDVCLELDCQNNGTCQRLEQGQGQCLCPYEWFGQRCEYDRNECEENICLNNGTCSNHPGGYRCYCQENFYGNNCQHKHICYDQSPCLNHGRCQVDDDGYQCLCSENYTGVHCEYPTCQTTPCLNNGTCVDDDERGFTCNCTMTGYHGDKCELDTDECLSSPCLNNGTCFDQINGYTCQCSKDFFGLQCENHEKFYRSFALSYHYIIWPSVIILCLLIILILLSVIINKVKEQRRLQGTYEPAINENGQNSRVEFSMILKPPPEERLI